MSFFKGHAGFNISGSKLQIVEIDYKEDKFILENVDEEYFSEFWKLSDSEAKIITILQKAYNEIILRKPLKSNHISFSLPDDIFKIVELPFESALSNTDLKKHIDWELSVLFPDNSPDEFSCQFILKDSILYKERKNILLIIIPKKYLKIFHKFAVRNNLKLRFVDNAHIAATSIITLENQDQMESKYLSVLVSEKTVSVIVVQNGNPVYFKISAIKSASELVTSIANEIQKVSDHGIDRSQIANFYISGESVSEYLLHAVKENMGISLIKLNPFNVLNISESLKENETYREKYNSFTSSTGITLRKV
ncbi:MAG: hypothetical protein PVH88_15760 [Ignavibacteria bacterium]|jgi:Tfp pilus assembly PilM family ATPase